MQTRLLAGLFSVVVCGAMIAPLLSRKPKDSFPLSTFPMFSIGHENPIARIHHVLAVTRDGKRRVLPPGIATGNRAGLQAEALVMHAVNSGSAEVFCRRALTRIEKNRRFASWAERIVSLEVAVSDFDAVAFFSGDKQALEKRTVHPRCWPKVAP
jgi:hypothetical protein